MQPEDVYELTGVADPRLSPDGSRVAYQVWTIDREANEYRGAIWVTALDGSERAAPLHLGRAARREPAVVAGRPLARVHLEPRRREAAAAALRHPRRGRRGAQAHRPQGERRGDRLGAGLDADRVHRARPRRGLRGGGRAQAQAAPGDAPLLQARQRRLDDRPAQPHPRRRPRRRRAAAAHRRRLRGRQSRLVAGRQAHRLQRAPRRALGHRAGQPPLRRRRRTAASRRQLTRRRRLCTRSPAFSPDGSPHRVPVHAATTAPSRTTARSA